jgi:ATP10 protein
MRKHLFSVTLFFSLSALILMGLLAPTFQSRVKGAPLWATDSAHHPLVGQRFPTVGGKSLRGREVSFPAETRGRVALLCVAYEQEDQPEVNSWTRPFDQMVQNQQDTSTLWYEVPMVSGTYTFMAGKIDEWMRQGIPSQLHDRVVTYYGPRDRYRTAFHTQAQQGGYAYLVDTAGVVRFVGERGATTEGLKQLKAKYLELVGLQ